MPQKEVSKRKDWIDFKSLKESARFEPVLALYGIEVTPKGQELVGRCLFHLEDKHPSFRVNLEKKVFHCFGFKSHRQRKFQVI